MEDQDRDNLWNKAMLESRDRQISVRVFRAAVPSGNDHEQYTRGEGIVYVYHGLFKIQSCEEEWVGQNRRRRLMFILVKDIHNDGPLLPLAAISG